MPPSTRWLPPPIVGAQGRLTEVYDMGAAGLRIVEINTYLATIDKVTPAYTDRNTHSTVDTVNLTALIASGDSDSFKNVEASGFTVDQYVLVTISKVGTKDAAVESVEAATVADGGILTGCARTLLVPPPPPLLLVPPPTMMLISLS